MKRTFVCASSCIKHYVQPSYGCRGTPVVARMDDNCGEWVECMGVASGCGEQEVGVASGSGWNLWVWLLGVVVRRYIDFLILLIPTPLVSVLFTAVYRPMCYSAMQI